MYSNMNKLKGGCMNKKKTGVFKFTLLFYYAHNLFLGIHIEMSLKRYGDAKTHFSKDFQIYKKQKLISLHF